MRIDNLSEETQIYIHNLYEADLLSALIKFGLRKYREKKKLKVKAEIKAKRVELKQAKKNWKAEDRRKIKLANDIQKGSIKAWNSSYGKELKNVKAGKPPEGIETKSQKREKPMMALHPAASKEGKRQRAKLEFNKPLSIKTPRKVFNFND